MSYNGIHDVIFDFNVLSELESSGIKYYPVYLKYCIFFSQSDYEIWSKAFLLMLWR